MADEKKPSKAQEFLVAHGEKVALGAAAGLLLIYLVFTMVLGEEDKTAANTKRLRLQRPSLC